MSEVKLISFNIRQSGLSDKDGEYQWNNRKEAVLNMLRAENPDIFGLQEALLEQVEYIEQNLPQYSRVALAEMMSEIQAKKSKKLQTGKQISFWAATLIPQ